MLQNSYYFEKMIEFKQKEIEKQSKEWWKYNNAKNSSTIKDLFSSVVKIFRGRRNDKNYTRCCCTC